MFNLLQLSKILNISLTSQTDGNLSFKTISTDTRTIQPGELFIALKGPNFDANHYVKEAAKKGAVAAIVSEPVASDIPILLVEDTCLALGQIAAFHREQFDIPLIALTGSAGKTTTKVMLASILQQCGSTLATEGTLNNHIGVPKTLLRLSNEHRYAVIEMGANHSGEIAYLTNMAKPTVAFITNAAAAHLEGFGDLPGVARAKGEIFQALAKDGTVIINADDQFCSYWQGITKNYSPIYFGIKNSAAFTAKDIHINEEGYASFRLYTPQGEIDIQLQIAGEHNVMNALAAAAAAQAVGASLAEIKAGLETAHPAYRRLVIHKGHAGATIIDDSYNANPLSVKAAIALLAKKAGEKIIALGEMRELGPAAASYHQEIGRVAKELGINHLYAYGQLNEFTVKAFGEQGFYFDDQTAMIDALRTQLNPDVTVLVKGSLSTQMDKVVKALLEK